MIRRKNAFNDKKKDKHLEEYMGLRLPRGVDFLSLPPAIVDGVFIGKKHEKVAFDYPVELGQKIVCIGTTFEIEERNGGQNVYLWNETLGNRVYSFSLPKGERWVCDIRLLDDGVSEQRQPRKRKKRKNTEEVPYALHIEGVEDDVPVVESQSIQTET